MDNLARLSLQYPYLTWKFPPLGGWCESVRLQSFGATNTRDSDIAPFVSYSDIHFVGGGGCGVVFFALDRSGIAPRNVALKTLRHPSQWGNVRSSDCKDPLLYQNEKDRRLEEFCIWLKSDTARNLAVRLRSEWQKMFIVDHPAVVSVSRSSGAITLKAGVRLPFVEMEHIQGPSLQARIELDLARRGVPHAPEDFAEMCCFAYRIADALAAMHDVGIAHRDVKATNIVIRGNQIDQCVLVDLGLARQRDDTGVSIGDDGIRRGVGTQSHMPWEQLNPDRDWKAAEYLVDQFALGVLLYRWCCNRNPYDSDDDKDPSSDFLPLAPSVQNRAVPSALCETIMRMIAKSPNDRHPSMRDLIASLEAKVLVPSVPPTDIICKLAAGIRSEGRIQECRCDARLAIDHILDAIHEIYHSNDDGAIRGVSARFPEKYSLLITEMMASGRYSTVQEQFLELSRLNKVATAISDSNDNLPGQTLLDFLRSTLANWRHIDMQLARVACRS